MIGIAGEAYLRLIGRFGNVLSDLSTDSAYWRFEPGVGLLHPPHMELTLSNSMDYWTVQRANSLGFLDREPIDPARAAESCHITIIGDSFVQAKEVPLSDKLQVRLEEIAAREAPHLDVTTSAFGIQNTGQVNQLPFYDRYARRMSPNMVVLAFYHNDLWFDNPTEKYALTPGYVPERLPYGQAVPDEDGNIRWFPPAIDFSDAVFTRAAESRNSWRNRAVYRVAGASYFMRWLGIKTKLISVNDPVYQRFRPSQDSNRRYAEWTRLMEDRGVMFDEQAFTEFALEQFKRRADHDGVALAILAVYDSGGKGDPLFDRMSEAAGSLGIPVISQHDYIIRQGGRVEDARFLEDFHWSPKGHQWAAEAIWEHIEAVWHGQCPQVEPRQDAEVDWVAVEEVSDEVEHEDAVQALRYTFELHHRFHTPDGEAQVQRFPTFDLEGYRAVHESVTSHRPTARSVWNVHLYDDGVTYIRDRCTAEDVENHFFLHVIPEDVQDLPEVRRDSGFESITFNVPSRGAMFDGKCLVSMDLPDYDISSISTGQFSDDVQIWKIDYNLAFPEIVDAVHEVRRSGREPVILANFDVYIDDGQLIYAKDSCNADDRELPFFLHVFPADENDLPDGRGDSGFDNLGFELIDKGGMHDGNCFAAVALPEYDIASIRTGQVADSVEAWSTYYNFGLPDIMDAVQELQSGLDPDIRSNFDVYIDNDQLVYVKESCSNNDRDLLFFLHVFPADENDLPDGRGDSGFDNLGFELIDKGGMHDGNCFAAVALPEYDISSIRTGQVADDTEAWSAYYNFGLPDIMDVVQELQRSDREPEIRSNFDVFMNDGQLVYVEESCSNNDRDLPFFLHVTPADENDLAEGRDESGFDNLDFELMQRGGESDGLCFAVVDLPAYDITGIRTGQWVRGEGNVWEASIEFTE